MVFGICSNYKGVDYIIDKRIVYLRLQCIPKRQQVELELHRHPFVAFLSIPSLLDPLD